MMLWGSGAVSRQLQEMLMNGGVGREFGMESGGEDLAFFHESGLAIEFGEDCDVRGDFFDDWSANEDHFERIFLERAGTEEDVAGELAAVTIAENRHVQEFEGILRGIFHARSKEDSAGTSAEDGAAFSGIFADCVIETFFLEELNLRGAFAARENKTTAAVEVSDGTDLNGFYAELLEHGGVRLEITLYRENADFHDYHSRNS